MSTSSVLTKWKQFRTSLWKYSYWSNCVLREKEPGDGSDIVETPGWGRSIHIEPCWVNHHTHLQWQLVRGLKKRGKKYRIFESIQLLSSVLIAAQLKRSHRVFSLASIEPPVWRVDWRHIEVGDHPGAYSLLVEDYIMGDNYKIRSKGR